MGRGLIKPQKPVGVVLQHQNSLSLGDIENFKTPAGRERHPRRVVEVGNEIQELDGNILPPQVRDAFAQSLRNHALIVHRHVFDPGLIGAEHTHGPHIAGRFS